MINWKEVAKFFAGVAAMESVAHTLIALSGILPARFFGILVTQQLNMIAVVFWPIVLFLLVYYAWIKK